MTESALTYQSIDNTVIDTLAPPGRNYWVIVALLFCGVLMGAACWLYQIFTGIGVAGQNNPVPVRFSWATSRSRG